MNTTKLRPINLVDTQEKLVAYADYVESCVPDNTIPTPFLEWQKDEEFGYNTEFVLNYETAAGGFLTGGACKTFKVIIPKNLVTESGGIIDLEGMKRIAKKFAYKVNHRLPTVVYRGKRLHHWTWD